MKVGGASKSLGVRQGRHDCPLSAATRAELEGIGAGR